MSNHNRMSFHEYAKAVRLCGGFSRQTTCCRLRTPPGRDRSSIFLSSKMSVKGWNDSQASPLKPSVYISQKHHLSLPSQPAFQVSSTSKVWQSTFILIHRILRIHPPYKLHYLNIPTLDNSVFDIDTTGGLRLRPCVVIDSLPERVGWVKACLESNCTGPT
jgi:hypothetical protein